MQVQAVRTAGECWWIETSRTGGEFDWNTNTEGPHVGYDTREDAEEWAAKLATIHPHVRMRHVTTAYVVVK